MANTSTTFDPSMQTPDALLDETESLLERAKARGSEALEDSVDLVRRNPGKSFAAAVLVGAAIGAVLVSSLASEPAFSDRLGELGEDAWEKVRDRAEDALAVGREALNAWMRKMK